jgi:signal peptidase I
MKIGKIIMKHKKRYSSGSRFIKTILSRENIEAILIAVVLALFIRTFVVQAFKIPSGSMEPTLLIGDHILVSKFIYGITIPFTEKRFFGFKKPKRSDVIVFVYPLDPSKDFIKRVIGVEGDKIHIKNKKIYINDKLYTDNHGFYDDQKVIKEWSMGGKRDNYGPKRVPPNCLFVMGDNRDKSYDSRWWGFVDMNKVKGKAFLIYWSWEGLFKNFRWERLSKVIH